MEKIYFKNDLTEVQKLFPISNIFIISKTLEKKSIVYNCSEIIIKIPIY